MRRGGALPLPLIPTATADTTMYQELDRNWELTTTYTSEIILDIGSLQDVFAPPALNDEA